MKIAWMLTLSLLFLAGCASGPPADPNNICNILANEKGWKKDARKAHKRWGLPPHVGFAFVHRESTFRARAKPERKKLLGVVPTVRPSSAFGYAQATDEAWSDYKKATGRAFVRRNNMGDALDFIGWYNYKSHKQLGIGLSDPENLYLAYHEGRGGFSKKSYTKKPKLRRIAKKVARTASQYETQLKKCRKLYECYGFHKFWPFCR